MRGHRLRPRTETDGSLTPAFLTRPGFHSPPFQRHGVMTRDALRAGEFYGFLRCHPRGTRRLSSSSSTHRRPLATQATCPGLFGIEHLTANKWTHRYSALRGSKSKKEPASEAVGTVTSYPRNAEIFGESEPADYIYNVIDGGVRTYKIFSDGRRQIGGFYFSGDIVGLEFARAHTFSAETIAATRLRVIEHGALGALAARDPEVAGELFALTTHELRRVQQRMLLLAKTAQERVASFLLEMAEHSLGGNAIDLPMPRQDIADYLGLTIETVSRTLRSLESCAAIEVPSLRHIVLRNRPALIRMNG